jgi:hypothetical protein
VRHQLTSRRCGPISPRPLGVCEGQRDTKTADGRDDGFLFYKSIVFGVGGSPLIWGLGASMRRRADQSLLEMIELCVEPRTTIQLEATLRDGEPCGLRERRYEEASASPPAPSTSWDDRGGAGYSTPSLYMD